MESDILKFILNSQGSVDTEELVCNLCDYALLAESDKFVSCVFSGRPRVVVRSPVTLCWGQGCQSCRRLHLCLGFLYSGTCPFSQLRGRCSFSHDLDSEHNKEVLTEFGLETLSRTELCLLLLQSNNMLLPPICFDYNNQKGCQGECSRLHVCQRYLFRDCSCPRTHDFSAPQPLQLLRKKQIPDHLVKVLRSVYANKQALWQADKAKAASSSAPGEREAAQSQDTQNAGMDSDASGSSKQNRGRGTRGRRGRGQGGNRHQDRAPSRGDSQESTNADLPEDDEVNDTCQVDDYESDSSSASTGRGRHMRGGYGQGRGNRRGRGNRQAASDVDGSNASQNFRGNRRGGRGWRGNRGSSASKAERTLPKDNLEHVEAEIGQNPTQNDEALSDTKTGSTSGNGQNSGKKQGASCGTGTDKSHHRTSPASNIVGAAEGSNQQQRRPRDKTEICMFFIKGHCIHEDRCFKAHDKMPYRWEIKQSGQWSPMTDNEKIEKDYCDPENTYSTTSPPVHFDTMKCKTDDVRRLSTINSVQEPDYLHTTDWLWYWEDEYGKWYQYAAITSEHRLSSITSKELEERYQKDNKDVVTFTAGSQSYELSLQDMLQTNLQFGTKRLVRRRPRFVSAADVQTKRKRPTNSTTVPEHWDKTHIPPVGFKTVTLQPSSAEYKEIQDLFHRTMAGFEILKIERIQNKTVWEAFQLCKTHMKIKNGGQPVLEKKLFHGTDPKHVDTICEASFDWRVCGVNGTVYGQGSYFARDAKYSHDYTGNCDPRFMFVSRVLVGEFAQGSPEYRRPPSKDGGDVNLFDSCVNNVTNPSIFVVFKEQQIYPEYLLQYRHTGRSYVYSQSSSNLFRTTPQPTVPTARANAPPVAPSRSTPGPTNTSTTTDTQTSCVIA